MPDYNRYSHLLNLSLLQQFICQNGKKKRYDKEDYFSHTGRIPRYMGYVVKGAFRYRSIHTGGSNCIVGYAFDEGFVGDYPAFQNKTISSVDIQAICDAEVYVINYQQLNRFYNANPENRLLAQKIAEVLLLEIYDRMLSLYNQTPTERYVHILENVPGLLTMISLKELASYLMVTPETLSRIRKKIVRNNS